LDNQENRRPHLDPQPNLNFRADVPKPDQPAFSPQSAR
jgi:hypothetical protein